MGKGGMRYGAGRPGWHVKGEHCHSIDVRRWAREGILHAGRSGEWAWIDAETGRQTGSIGYCVGSDAVVLIYSMNDTQMRQHVPVLTTACTYGGRRYWFGCPGCGKRLAVLFLRETGFGCRTCASVAYSCQSETELDRARRQLQRIEQQLGPVFSRPKGMHQATQARLLLKYIALDRIRDDMLARWINQLHERHPMCKQPLT
jgi:hypothetical protein